MILNRAFMLPPRTGDSLESGLYFDAGHGGRLGWNNRIDDPPSRFSPTASIRTFNKERIV